MDRRNRREPSCSHCELSFSFKDPTNPIGGRCPLLLRCGHSVCEGCMRSSVRGKISIKCTICSVVSEANEFKHGDLREEFPLNVYAVGQVALRRSIKMKSVDSLIGFYAQKEKMAPSTVLCGECGNAPAVCSCRQCNEPFCVPCFSRVHSSSKTLRKHEKIALNAVDKIPASEEIICQEHPHQTYKFYCTDCSTYFCLDCKSHMTHTSVEVAEKNEELLKEFTEAFEEANAVLKQLYGTQRKMKSLGMQFQDEEAIKVEKQVAVHYSHLHGLLQLEEDQFMKKIKSSQEKTQSSLLNISSNIENNIKEMETILAESQRSTEPQNRINIPLFYMLEKLRNVSAMPCHLVLNEEQDSSKYGFFIGGDVMEMLKGHCTVTVPTKRAYELSSKFELPENYVIENTSDLPDPVKNTGFNSLNLDVMKQKILFSSGINKVVPKTLPQTEAKTKKTSFQDVLRKAHLQTLPIKEIVDDSLSTSSADSALESLCNLSALDEGTTELVRMCHLISPSNFYVQRKSCFGLLEKIGEHFSKQSNIKRAPPDIAELGQMYLVQFAKDTKWYRAVVKEVMGSKCSIFYIDYGNTEMVPIKKLREISDKFMKMPGQAIHCSLFGCAPIDDDWNEEAFKLMASLSNGFELSMYVERVNHSSGLHEIHLRRIDDKLGSFTDALIFVNCARQTESTNLQEGFYANLQSIKIPTYTEVYIDRGERFEAQITTINTPGNFYIQRLTTDSGKFMEELKKDLNSAYSHIGPDDFLIHNPSVGRPVAALFSDGNWYRAVIIKIPKPCFVEIQYVDYGFVETITWRKIRMLHSKFLKTAKQALKCRLCDVAPIYDKGWTISAKRTFENMAKKGIIIKVVVDYVKDKQLSIILYEPQRGKDICINALLVKKGHAKSIGKNSTEVEFLHTIEHQSDSDALSSSSKNKRSLNNQPLEDHVMTCSTSSNSDISQQWEQNGEANRIKIKIVKYISPSEIYVTFETVWKQIKRLTKEMTTFYDTSEVEIRDWSLGDLCAVKNQEKKTWSRGLITETSCNIYQVFLKDSADVVEVNDSELRSLEPQFTKVMDGTVRCHLCAVLPAGGKDAWPAGHYNFMIATFESFNDLYMKKLGEMVDGSLPVQLWAKYTKVGGALDPVVVEWKDINQTFIASGLALPDRNSEHYSALQKDNDESECLDFNNYTFQLDNESPVSSRGIFNLRRQPIAARNSTREKKISESLEKLNLTAVKTVKHHTPSTDWKPAEPFTNLEFEANATYVDYESAIYLQDKEKGKYNLELIRRGLRALHGDSSSKPHDLEWSKGQICIAFYDIDKNWYRGKVMDITMKGVEVMFVDYGNTETVQPDQLRKQITLDHIPIQCHRCLTVGLIPISHDGKWSVSTLDFIHTAIVDKSCHVKLMPTTTVGGNYIILNLKLPNGDDLMQLLNSMKLATYVIDCNQVGHDNEEIVNEPDSTVSYDGIKRTTSYTGKKPLSSEVILPSNNLSIVQERQNAYVYDWFDKHEFTPKLITSEFGFKELVLPDSLVELYVEVPVVSSSVSVQVTIVNCDDEEVMAVIKEFTKLQLLIQEEADNLAHVMQPVKGLPCIGCYTSDNVWYRAVILDVIDSENVKVQYVDYGNEEDLSIERLREIKDEWMKIPAQAFRVFLHNVHKGPDYQQELCQQMLMNSFLSSPYLMSIQARQPCLQVELFDNNEELAYQPVIDSGLLFRINE